MEKRLFNLYLKYIEERCPSVWKHLKKIPRNIKFHMVSMIICYALAIIFLSISKHLNDTWLLIVSVGSIIFLILCVIFGLFLFFSTEKYEIAVSDKTMNEYWQYCFEIRKWFSNNFVVGNSSKEDIDNDILEVKKRIDLFLSEQTYKNENKNSRIDKWVQALAIPFVLAIITAILNKRETIILAISEILAILLVFVALFGVIWTIYSVRKVFKRQKFEQMKHFSEDLQGALDCQKYATNMPLTKNDKENQHINF